MTEPVYRDLDLSFRKHPLTGDISTFIDEDAIKSAIRNLVRIARYEKPFQPNLFSPVYELLFEPISEPSSSILSDKLLYLIKTLEPRIQKVQVKAVPVFDENRYDVTINYEIKKIQSQQTLELTIPVERLR